MYGEEVEQIDEESYAEKIRNHPAVQYYGAGEDHHMINLKKGYHFHFGGADHMHSSSADNVRMAYQDLKKVKKCSDDKENCEHHNYGSSSVPRVGEMEKALEEEVWDNPMPDSKKQGSLTPEQKAKAKARADRAGRKYPNMIDNMWASKQ